MRDSDHAASARRRGSGRHEPSCRACRASRARSPATRGSTRTRTCSYYNIWANISYGYVGQAAGFSAGDLQHGAELNAWAAQTNTPGNWIGRQIGIDLYAHYKPDRLTPQAIDDEINAHLSQLAAYSEYQSYPSSLTAPPSGSDWQGGDLPNSPIGLSSG
ncbi:polymorphic toxin type 44 domain-containing protein [Actinacidiphila oryziradicis]|uniref:polymorphic toxin type 44 domain-containing protein n=1 Tax=Actinacidiphila oryziradicis TaxID=2571141 RepID=UPI00145F4DEC|nr:polymorphic toxin type 44 domain-containing protein [Actinacidiphila oryziradicis]